MKRRYLIKFLILGVIYWCLMFVLKLVTPIPLGNHQLTKKMRYFENEATKVNTVFFGNSTVNRHINPIVFDEYTTADTYSYNLASDATPMMERSFLIEWFVKNYKVDRVVLLVGHSADLRKVNLNTLRVIYYHDWKRLLYAFKYRSEKTKEKLNHIGAFFKNQLSMFRIKELLSYRSIQNAAPEAYKNNRGFFAYDLEEGLTDFQNRGYIATAHKYKPQLKKAMQERDFSRYPMTHKDRAIVEECHRLQKVLEESGTQLIFLFPPNSPQYYHYGLENSIYMGDGSEFKAFYKFEYRYNPGHLNSKGADIYSRRLGLLFNKFDKQK